MQDIHGLKPLMTMAFPWFSVVLFGLGLLGLLLGVVWVLWRLWRKRPEKPHSTVPQTAPTPPPKDPREQALKALQKLRAYPDQPDAFYLKLEHILRRYLSATCTENMQSYTASELSRFFQGELPNLPAAQRDALFTALRHGEQAKFAQQSLTAGAQNEDLEAVKAFITNHDHAKGALSR